MKQVLLLLFAGIMITSCMDVNMDVEVDSTGGITYSGEVDLSSIMPMVAMTAEMGEIAEGETDPVMEILQSGGRVDTIMSIFDLEEDISQKIEITEEMREKFKVRMLLDKGKSIFKMNFLTKYNSLDEQTKFLEVLAKSQKEGEEAMTGDPDMITGLLATELDIEKGFMVFKSVLNEKQETDEETENLNFPSSGFGDALEPSLNLNITVPGKVLGVEGADYTKINDWKINLKIPLETEDPNKETVRINFEPHAVFRKPEVTEVWNLKPKKISLNGKYKVPSDAIVLLGDSGLDSWTHLNGQSAKWEFKDGVMTVRPGTGDINTRESFGDCQLHIEWRIPEEKGKNGQGKGNSGIFLQSLYEVQVLDSYKNETYSNGQAGSIYKQAIPAVNASKAPGEWQEYDIIYKAPKFNQLGMKEAAARITVIHNGVIIHNDQEIKGTSEYIGLPKNPVHGDAPLKLQDHSNKVSYRNIWIRKL